MRRRIVDNRPHWDHAARVHGFMAGVVVVLDVLHGHRSRHAVLLFEIADIARQVRLVGDAAQDALEMDPAIHPA